MTGKLNMEYIVLESMNPVRRMLKLYKEVLVERMDLPRGRFQPLYLLRGRFPRQFLRELGTNYYTDFRSPGNNTLLHLAARMGDKSLVEELLNLDTSLLTAKSTKDNTPLHLAACSGHVDVVRSLIQRARRLDVENGAYEVIKMRNMKGNTPLHEAVRNGHYLVALLLVDEAPQANRRDLLVSVNNAGESPLSMAIDANHYYLMKKIVQTEETSLLHKGPNDQTPLHRAILRADIDTIKFLLEKRRELISEKDSYGRTPLHYAAASGANLAVRLVLRVDASIALLQDHYQATPAHLAAQSNRRYTLSIVLGRCPHSVELLNQHSQNVLHAAAQNGCVDVVKYVLSLLEADDLINEPDKDGNTPLHLAAMNFHSSVVRCLTWTSKVDIRATNNDGKTALDVAQFLSQERAVDPSPGNNDDDKITENQLTINILKEAYAKKAENLKDFQEKLTFELTGKRRQELSNVLMLVAILIATVTFSAAFTIPGGVQSQGPHEGMVVLGGHVMFRIFIITDTIAMTSSMTATLILVLTSVWTRTEIIEPLFKGSIILVSVALMTMGLAFVTGLSAVLLDQWPLAIVVCCIGVFFTDLVYGSLFSWSLSFMARNLITVKSR